MGMDLVLGVIVLFAAFRGWLKGFTSQAIRLGGLVAAAYSADYVRDQVKPYCAPYLPTIRPDLVDRILWWGSAAVGYFVIVGVASMAATASRRRPLGLAEPNRGDQFGGFGLGLAKGVLGVAFLLAAVERYGTVYVSAMPWAGEQARESYAWDWNQRYHPAARVWAAPPVQHFVAHIQKMGLNPPPSPESAGGPAPLTTATAAHAPNLAVPADGTGPEGPGAPLEPELLDALERLKQEIGPATPR